MGKNVYRRITNLISTLIAYAVIFGPIIILVVMIGYTCYGKISSVVDGTTFHSPFEKKVYYTVDGDCYHESRECPTLQRSENVYRAYKDELSGRTRCEQCAGWR